MIRLLLALLVAGHAAVASRQNAVSADQPKIDVVSIKVSTESSPFRSQWTPGRFSVGEWRSWP